MAGLIPGLHMNNMAAGLTANASAALAAFAVLGQMFGSEDGGLILSCFISAALIAHLFAESVTSAYLGIPAGDAVSVLPAHRLAKAGLGRIAVKAGADGCMAGIVGSTLVLLPMCVLMGHPVHLYSSIKSVMGFVIVGFSAVLLLSEVPSILRTGHFSWVYAARLSKAFGLFLASGILGGVILLTNFFAAPIQDFSWMGDSYVPKSSLLLPLFAGLFGIPSLINSLGSSAVCDMSSECRQARRRRPRARDYLTMTLGGVLVGWMPGMTSGSSATLCSPGLRDEFGEKEIDSSSRFIWLYSAISASGAVFSVGALFVILRARSGSMDAVQFFMGDMVHPDYLEEATLPMAAILLSMILAACVSHRILGSLDVHLPRLHNLLCSRRVTLASLAFVCSLSAALTGVRGLLVISTATCLGLMPSMIGVRRIQLMGCLLIPIAVSFFSRQ